MTMHTKVLLLACLACFCHARRVSERKIDTAANPSSDLATLLSAFNPSGPMVRPTQNIAARHPVKSMKGHILDAERSEKPTLSVGRRSYSPAMVEARKDYWTVVVVGALLAGISGFVNIVAFLEAGLPITHHTGTASHYGRLVGLPTVGFGNIAEYVALKLGIFMVAYSAGAAVAGATKADGDAPFVGKFSPQLLGVAVVIALGAFAMETSYSLALGLWSFSQGMMNAVTSAFPAGPIRVTHVSGSLTDLGLGVGRWINAKFGGGALPSLKKPFFLFLQVFTFALGGFIARLMQASMGASAALAPAIALAILSAGRPAAKTEEAPVPAPA